HKIQCAFSSFSHDDDKSEYDLEEEPDDDNDNSETSDATEEERYPVEDDWSPLIDRAGSSVNRICPCETLEKAFTCLFEFGATLVDLEDPSLLKIVDRRNAWGRLKYTMVLVGR